MTQATPVAIVSTANAADRIDQVVKWILSGASEHEIRGAIEATYPDVKVRPLIVDAMKRIAKAGDGDPGLIRAWAREALRTVYQQAMQAGDFGSALRALKMIVEFTEGA